MRLPDSKKWFWLAPLLLVIALAAGVAVWFFFFKKQVEPFAAVPSDSALVIDFQGFTQIRDSLDGREWAARFSSLTIFQQFKNDLALTRRAFDSLPVFKNALQKNRLLAALTFNQTDSLHAVFILDLGGRATADLAHWLPFSEALRWFPYQFRGGEVFTIYVAGGQKFAAAGVGNVLIFARSTYLVEDALGQILSAGRGLLDDHDFCEMVEKTPAPMGVRLFFQPSVFVEQLSPRFSEGKKIALAALKTNIRWAALALDSTENLRFHGRLKTQPLSPLALFEKQNAPPPNLPDDLPTILPDNTAAFFQARFSDKNAVFGAPEFLPKTDFERFVRPWAGDEVAWVVTEPFSAGLSDEQFLVVPIVDSLAAVRRLTLLGRERGVLKRYQYNTFEITQFLSGDCLAPLLFSPKTTDGEPPVFQNPCAARVGRFMIFSHSTSAMELFVDKFIVSQTLSNAADFLILVQNSRENGPISGFLNAAFLPAFSKAMLREPFQKSASRDLKTMARAGALRFSMKKMVGENGWLDFELNSSPPVAEAASQTTILWKTPLAAEAAAAPSVVRMPSGGHRILIQDVENQLYFFTEGGELLWKRRLESRLLGPVVCLDWETNGQPFFLMNTAQKVHLFDENGEESLGFPLDLASQATASVAAFDFERTNRWQFFVPCLNGNTYGFDQSGRPLAGWNPCPTGVCRFAVQHFQYDFKDWLLTLSERGDWSVFARNGDPRKQLFLSEGPFLSPPAWDTSRLGPRIVASNFRGKTWVLNLKGEWFSIFLQKTKASRLAFSNVGGDARRDFLQLADTSLVAFGWRRDTFQNLFRHVFSQPQDSLFVVPFGKKETRIGTFCRAARQVFLIDKMGENHPDFPLAATTPFVMADLFQNGRVNVLVVANGRRLMAILVRGG